MPWIQLTHCFCVTDSDREGVEAMRVPTNPNTKFYHDHLGALQELMDGTEDLEVGPKSDD